MTEPIAPSEAGAGDDPRVERTRQAVRAAARTLLVREGWDAVTQLRVAEESGVGRTTLYRHWPDRSALLYEVLRAEELSLHIEPTGELAHDLRAYLDRFCEAMARPDERRIISAILDRAEWDRSIMALKVRIVERTRSFVSGLLQQAVGAGLLQPDLDTDVATAELLGPVLFRGLVSGEPLAGGFTDAVVDAFLAAHRVP